MVNNDYLSFDNLNDLKKYAEEHNIFDNKVMEEFYNAYIPNLADDNFNEHYYLNREYNGKTPLDLIKERTNYLAGIEKLETDGKITEKQANAAKDALTTIKNKEIVYADNSMNEYHKIASGNTPLIGTKDGRKLMLKELNTITLNQKMLSKEAAGYELQSDDFERKTNFWINELAKANPEFDRITLQAEREKLSSENKELAENLTPKNKDYSIWLLKCFEDVVKNTASITNPIEKENAEKKIMGALAFTTDAEKEQLKEIENRKISKVRDLEEEKKKISWLNFPKRWKANATIKNAIKEKDEEIKRKSEEIREKRVYEYQKFKKAYQLDSISEVSNDGKLTIKRQANIKETLEALATEKNRIEKQTISQISQKSETREQALSHSAINIGKSIESKASEALKENEQRGQGQ
ncbi:MAG: hypothetical protein Ta2D_07990 [Rickettsiales bacterium]|nr:MAG: hypothetical protein Ta2D_07990 [Rickettsiales bacterium]